jgi:hydrogenase nickel incorporation protein HypB
MCETCGCSDEANVTIVNLDTGKSFALESTRSFTHSHGHSHDHSHDHDHGNSHDADESHHHGHGSATTIPLAQAVLAKNDALAERNRAWFAGREILAINLLSAPGAGKTTLLERTIADLRETYPLFVIEGDQATTNDGIRIKRAGAPVVQVNTGSGCHLDAHMIARGLAELRPTTGSVLMIENVGNLVCPALFDLGEYAKVAVLSVTDGEDKPLKYPHIVRAATLLLINKSDLLPHVEFDLGNCRALARQVNPAIEVLAISAKTGEGLKGWYDWISTASQHVHAAAFP